ncbi:MBL fold metallo-hydrolase [Acrocarpospora catenulata]|uniref:MBL fold metallo-hydrolase n=1 Tax=Acrocarpospora catenulata TaxID=2836182 RepID=UPI001BD9E9E4|nr:MBL fold metallo-hydrolase [Acrocarpospora catenulata]
MTSALTLTHLGHSCVLLEFSTGTRVLLDPGAYGPSLSDIAAVDAVVVTHAHPDHLDLDHLAQVTATSGAIPLFGAPDVAELVREAGVEFHAVEEGGFSIGSVDVTAVLTTHEQLYPGVPLPINYGFVFAGRVFAPGDSLSAVPVDADVLLAPLGAPWMKLSEGIDYVRRMAARTVIPIHDAGLAPVHRALHRMLLANFAPEGTTVTTLDVLEQIEL